MTIDKKNKILELNRVGKSTRQIAEIIGIHFSTIADLIKSNKDIQAYAYCRMCGKEIKIPNKKHGGVTRAFCDDKCRYKWHKRFGPKKMVSRVCEFCRKEFTSVSFRNNKFCSRSCANKSHGKNHL